jgi:flagellar protein FlaF
VTALDLARTAYSSPGTPARTPRGTEYDLFARITHQLRSAQSDGRKRSATLAGAIHDNRRLWMTLAADVADPGNALPAPLRARIFYLYQFTDAHSRKVLAGEAGVEVLIDINTAIMRGLRGEGAVT